MILRLSLNLPEDRAYISTIRLLNRALLEHQKVVPADIDDTITIIDELCTNVVRHAHSQAHCFTVTLEYYSERMTIEVMDHGDGFRKEDIGEVGSLRPDFDGGERFGGFGMPMVQAVSDKYEVTTTVPHGTTVYVEKRLRYETQYAKDASLEMDKSDGRTARISVRA